MMLSLYVSANDVPYGYDTYAFIALPQGTVTMDVVKEDGMGSSGTFLCKDLRSCYTKVLQAEERGATQYCKSITLKRDGVTVWKRDYNDPYWIAIKSRSNHDRWH